MDRGWILLLCAIGCADPDPAPPTDTGDDEPTTLLLDIGDPDRVVCVEPVITENLLLADANVPASRFGTAPVPAQPQAIGTLFTDPDGTMVLDLEGDTYVGDRVEDLLLLVNTTGESDVFVREVLVAGYRFVSEASLTEVRTLTLRADEDGGWSGSLDSEVRDRLRWEESDEFEPVTRTFDDDDPLNPPNGTFDQAIDDHTEPFLDPVRNGPDSIDCVESPCVIEVERDCRFGASVTASVLSPADL